MCAHQPLAEISFERIKVCLSLRMSKIEDLKQKCYISWIWLNHVHAIHEKLNRLVTVISIFELNLLLTGCSSPEVSPYTSHFISLDEQKVGQSEGLSTAHLLGPVLAQECNFKVILKV